MIRLSDHTNQQSIADKLKTIVANTQVDIGDTIIRFERMEWVPAAFADAMAVCGFNYNPYDGRIDFTVWGAGQPIEPALQDAITNLVDIYSKLIAPKSLGNSYPAPNVDVSRSLVLDGYEKDKDKHWQTLITIKPFDVETGKVIMDIEPQYYGEVGSDIGFDMDVIRRLHRHLGAILDVVDGKQKG